MWFLKPVLTYRVFPYCLSWMHHGFEFIILFLDELCIFRIWKNLWVRWLSEMEFQTSNSVGLVLGLSVVYTIYQLFLTYDKIVIILWSLFQIHIHCRFGIHLFSPLTIHVSVVYMVILVIVTLHGGACHENWVYSTLLIHVKRIIRPYSLTFLAHLSSSYQSKKIWISFCILSSYLNSDSISLISLLLLNNYF